MHDQATKEQISEFSRLVKALSKNRKKWLGRFPLFAELVGKGLYDKAIAILLLEGFDYPSPQ